MFDARVCAINDYPITVLRTEVSCLSRKGIHHLKLPTFHINKLRTSIQPPPSLQAADLLKAGRYQMWERVVSPR